MDLRLLTASWTQKPRTRVQNRNNIRRVGFAFFSCCHLRIRPRGHICKRPRGNKARKPSDISWPKKHVPSEFAPVSKLFSKLFQRIFQTFWKIGLEKSFDFREKASEQSLNFRGWKSLGSQRICCIHFRNIFPELFAESVLSGQLLTEEFVDCFLFALAFYRILI
jgi:hypothetical protein